MVEAEPIRYELRDIKIDPIRKHVVVNETILGTTTLSNNGQYSNLVESVIAYQYDKVQYWGTYEGVARGLPTNVHENGKATVQLERGWGLEEVFKKDDVIIKLFSYSFEHYK